LFVAFRPVDQSYRLQVSLARIENVLQLVVTPKEIGTLPVASDWRSLVPECGGEGPVPGRGSSGRVRDGGVTCLAGDVLKPGTAMCETASGTSGQTAA